MPPGSGRVSPPRTRRLAAGPHRRHPVQVGVAVVGQQQLDGSIGQDLAERPLDDVDHLRLALGHVQRVGQAALEALALHLRVTDLCLAVGVGDRFAQLGGQAEELLVCLGLLACGDEDQCGRHRPENRDHQPGRHEVRCETRRHRFAGHDARDEDRGNDDEPADQAQPAQPLGPGDLARPLLLGDHGFLFPPDADPSAPHG